MMKMARLPISEKIPIFGWLLIGWKRRKRSPFHNYVSSTRQTRKRPLAFLLVSLIRKSEPGPKSTGRKAETTFLESRDIVHFSWSRSPVSATMTDHVIKVKQKIWSKTEQKHGARQRDSYPLIIQKTNYKENRDEYKVKRKKKIGKRLRYVPVTIESSSWVMSLWDLAGKWTLDRWRS